MVGASKWDRAWNEPGTLGALIERLENAERTLTDLAHDNPDQMMALRLTYKRDGVSLALSYALEEQELAQMDRG